MIAYPLLTRAEANTERSADRGLDTTQQDRTGQATPPSLKTSSEDALSRTLARTSVAWPGPETATWDEFPNGRWGDSRSPAYGEMDGYGASLKIPVSFVHCHAPLHFVLPSMLTSLTLCLARSATLSQMRHDDTGDTPSRYRTFPPFSYLTFSAKRLRSHGATSRFSTRRSLSDHTSCLSTRSRPSLPRLHHHQQQQPQGPLTASITPNHASRAPNAVGGP